MAKFLSELNNDITKKDIQQNCLIDKTNRTERNKFRITKCQVLDMLETVYICFNKREIDARSDSPLYNQSYKKSNLALSRN